MARSYSGIGAAVVAALLVGSSALAQEGGQTVVKRGTITRDLYVAGGTVEVRADVQGDVVAAGGRILIAERVAADVMAAGGTVDIAAQVLDDVRAAGGTVTLRGPVTGDAIAAGGTVEITADGSVGERAWLAGGTIDVAGRVGTHLKAGGERVTISGTVDGDVEVRADELTISPTARIAGKLTYRSPRAAVIDPAAQIAGGVTREALPRPGVVGRVGARLWFLAAMGLLGAAWILVFPGFAAATAGTVRGEPWKVLGLGAGTLIGVPVLAIVLLVTVVGAVLGATVGVAFLLALGLAVVAGALGLGELALGAMRRSELARPGERVAAMLAGLVALVLLRLIPVVGAVLCFVVLLLGLGALVLSGYRRWRGTEEPAAAGM